MNAISQRGISMVELMVGITVGLIVVAGATLVATNQIAEHRRLMLETQLQQDLRSAADLVQRDIRRTGFFGKAEEGVWSPATIFGPGAVAAVPNPYGAASVAEDGTLKTTYSDALKPTTPEDSIVTASETHGFSVSERVLRVFVGGVLQPLTDPAAMSISTAGPPSITVQSIPLDDFCDKPCDAGTACPRLQVRTVNVTLVAQSVRDPLVRRSVNVRDRIRADAIEGTCPP